MVLRGLRRMLHSMRNDWEMQFAGGAEEALAFLAANPFDVIVSDMRMPKMNGAELLNEVMKRSPNTIRIIFSGFADQELVMRCVGGTHQYISKPCEADTLIETVSKALELEELIGDRSIKELINQMPSLPLLPSTYFEVSKEVDSPDGSVERVAEIVSDDPGLTAKILQLVNSAFFGLASQIASPQDAVMHLGMDTIKSLVLGIDVFSEFDQTEVISIDELWAHCISTGNIARRIAQLEKEEKKVADESFTTGLLHDIGKLVLVVNLPSVYSDMLSRVERDQISVPEAEEKDFGVSHAEWGHICLGFGVCRYR